MKIYGYIGPTLMKHYRPLLGDYDLVGKGLEGKITKMIHRELAVFTEPSGLATWYIPMKYLVRIHVK